MTTTVGKSVPAMSPEIFNPVEMDTPAAVRVGSAFTVRIKINADPTSAVYSTWQFFREKTDPATGDPTAAFSIDLFADTVGPGTDLKLTATPHSESLVSGQDNYDITLSPDPSFPTTADKGVWELAAVITLVDGGTPVGWSAFIGDALIQVS